MSVNSRAEQQHHTGAGERTSQGVGCAVSALLEAQPTAEAAQTTSQAVTPNVLVTGQAAPNPMLLGHGIKILIADDHPVARSGIRAVLRGCLGVESVLEAATGRQAVQSFRAARPHAVFMDDGMPRLNGWRATTEIIEEFPDARVVIVSMRTDVANLQRACDCGALGYVLKTDPISEFQRALQDVLQGRVYVSTSVSARASRAAAERRKAFVARTRKV